MVFFIFYLKRQSVKSKYLKEMYMIVLFVYIWHRSGNDYI